MAKKITLTASQVQWIGDKIYENECSSKSEHLLEWNDGEEFLSLGIGHFIWYPSDRQGPFDEGFIKLLDYLKSSGEELPAWLNTKPFPGCPWLTREDFLRNRHNQKARELQQFLNKTKSKQSEFIINRFEKALPLILANTSPENRLRIQQQFDHMSSTREGTFALIDYVNFKGLGVSQSERYQGKGWGLLQVLLAMERMEDEKQVLREFVRVAKIILEERVKNSPPQRNEKRWLVGWQKRLSSYLN
ncbi:MAG: hypothetical protein H6754_06625 [Candidatus Omnitrophica bacterium]|nr:hypothetical protein [Candidatus Omnitrophota bacterium]